MHYRSQQFWRTKKLFALDHCFTGWSKYCMYHIKKTFDHHHHHHHPTCYFYEFLLHCVLPSWALGELSKGFEANRWWKETFLFSFFRRLSSPALFIFSMCDNSWIMLWFAKISWSSEFIYFCPFSINDWLVFSRHSCMIILKYVIFIGNVIIRAN